MATPYGAPRLHCSNEQRFFRTSRNLSLGGLNGSHVWRVVGAIAPSSARGGCSYILCRLSFILNEDYEVRLVINRGGPHHTVEIKLLPVSFPGLHVVNAFLLPQSYLFLAK